MNSPAVSRQSVIWAITPFVGAWCLLAAGAVRVRFRDPFGASITHSGYGENQPGDLTTAFVGSAIELCVLAAIVRPWQPRHRRRRTAVALALYTPWALLGFIVTMHAGSISAVVVFWRFLVLFLLLVASVVPEAAIEDSRAAAG